MSTTPNKWFTSYTKQSKPLLIKGDIGYGKTFIINELCKQHNLILIKIELDDLTPINLNISDSFTSKKLLVIEDLNMQLIIYPKALDKLKKIIKIIKKPLIITCLNEFHSKLKPIENKCVIYKIIKKSLNAFNKILSPYKINPQLKRFYIQKSNGDIRNAIINCNLQCKIITQKNHNYDIFTTIKKLLNSQIDQNIKFNLINDYDFIVKMLYKNYLNSVNSFEINDYEKIELLSNYSDDLSCIDLFNWGDWESLEIISSIMIGRTHKHFNLNKCEISNYSFKPKNKFIEENHFKIMN